MKLSSLKSLMILLVFVLGSLNLFAEEHEVSVDINEWTAAGFWDVSGHDCSISSKRTDESTNSINVNCPFSFYIEATLIS